MGTQKINLCFIFNSSSNPKFSIEASSAGLSFDSACHEPLLLSGVCSVLQVCKGGKVQRASPAVFHCMPS